VTRDALHVTLLPASFTVFLAELGGGTWNFKAKIASPCACKNSGYRMRKTSMDPNQNPMSNIEQQSRMT